MEEGMGYCMDWRRSSLLALMLAAMLLAGCRKNIPPVDYNKELPPGQVALRKISPGEYPDFSKSTWNLQVLATALEHSIYYMNLPSSTRGYPYLDISHERAKATLIAFREVINSAMRQPNPGQYIEIGRASCRERE